jgi:hypothetical protein
MASLFDPPPLLSILVTLAAAGAVGYVLRRMAFIGSSWAPAQAILPAEDEETWGAEPPPPPEKRPYIYPSDRPTPEPTPLLDGQPPTDDIPAPPAAMAHGWSPAPVAPVAPAEAPVRPTTEDRLIAADHVEGMNDAPPAQSHLAAEPPSPSAAPLSAAPLQAVKHPPSVLTERDPDSGNSSEDEGEDEEVSLADLFARRRRPRPQPPGRS